MNFTPACESALANACSRAIQQRQALCDAEQLLEAILIARDESRAAERVADSLADRPQLSFHPPVADLARSVRTRVLPEAERIASDLGAEELDEPHVLHALLGPHSPVPERLREAVIAAMRQAGQPVPAPEPTRRPAEPERGSRVRAAELLEPFLPNERDASLVPRPELEDAVLAALLFGNPLLVGPLGSGRRSIARRIAQRFADGDLPPALGGRLLVRLDPMRLVAGTSYRGELEERVQDLLEELTRRPGTILVVENLAQLAPGKHAHAGFDVAAALAPALRDEHVRLLGIVTPDDLRERLEAHPDLLAAMTVVPVPAADEGEATRLLGGLGSALESRFGAGVAPEAPAAAVELCRRHVPQRPLPGEAVALIEAAVASLAFERAMLERNAERRGQRYWTLVAGEADRVGERHLLEALSKRHRIPFEHLQGGIVEKLDQLEQSFRATLFGQDHVLDTLLRTLKVALLQLNDPRRPRGRLFLVGPPGTGKTESARLLAQYLTGSAESLLRLDMSDYQEAASVSTLLGSDKGLVGNEEGGRLTEPVRENPHSVVLFDEIEKAHPNVFNLFLQILDNGEIQDKRGHKVSFRHALCIFTSNAGCSGSSGLFGLDREQMVARLGGVFRPEFLDRIEDFVAFRALEAEARRSVLRSQLDQFAAQVNREHRRTLTWDEALVEAGLSQDEAQPGARSLLRWVQRVVKPAVADALLGAGAARGRIILGADPDGRPIAKFALAPEVHARIERPTDAPPCRDVAGHTNSVGVTT